MATNATPKFGRVHVPTTPAAQSAIDEPRVLAVADARGRTTTSTLIASEGEPVPARLSRDVEEERRHRREEEEEDQAAERAQPYVQPPGDERDAGDERQHRRAAAAPTSDSPSAEARRPRRGC